LKSAGMSRRASSGKTFDISMFFGIPGPLIFDLINPRGAAILALAFDEC